MNKQTLLIFLMLCLLAACNLDKNRVDQTAIAEEKKKRELKRLSETEITLKAQEVGQQLVADSEKQLLSLLTNALGNNDVAGALQYCDLHAQGALDSLKNPFNGDMKRVSLQNRNSLNAPDSVELPILEAYAYSVSQGTVPDAQLQKATPQYYIYTKPIVLGNPLCLQCHGVPGETLNPEAAKLLQELYPNDKATGYQLGDFRGIWRVYLSKKDLVRGM